MTGKITSLVLLGTAMAAQAAEPIEMARGQLRLGGMLQAVAERDALTDGAENPGNQLARLAARRAVLDFRPDLRFTNDTLEVRLNPRVRVDQSSVSVAGRATRGATGSAYVNEWMVRATPNEKLALSVGRQVLLWGPATLYSPSNPFFSNNGRDNPYVERDGTDFFTTTYFPADGWVLSYIDNFAQGWLAPPPLTQFARTRLLKLDRTGGNYYWSVNYANTVGKGTRVAAAVQWTVSDALVVYAEGAYLRHKTAYRPQFIEGAWQFVAPDTAGDAGIGVLGAMYTLESGQTLSMEYLRNSQGWSAAEFSDSHRLAQQAAARLGGQASGEALPQLARAAAPGTDLLVKNYLFFQYLHPDAAAGRDMTLRATRSMGSNAWRLGATVEQRFGKRYSVFAQLVSNEGDLHGEFFRYLRWQVQLGLKAGF